MSNFPALLSGTGADSVPFHVHNTAELVGSYGDLQVGDIRSANWDGGSDLSAGYDPAATSGYLLDASEGAAQMSDNWAAGTAGGGLVRFYQYGVGFPALQLLLGSDSGHTPIAHGYLYQEAHAFSLISHRLSVDEYRGMLRLLPEANPNLPASSLVVLQPSGQTTYLSLTASGRMILQSSTISDPDSYLAHPAGNRWQFFMGDHNVLDLQGTGVAVSIAGQLRTLGLSGVNVVVTGVLPTPLAAAFTLVCPGTVTVADATRVGTVALLALTAPQAAPVIT